MPRFDDYLSSHGEINPESFDYNAFVGELKEAYEADKGVWDAQIASNTEALTAKEAELNAAKLHNYDLLMRIPGDKTPPPNNAGDTGGDPDDDHDPDIKLDDLFK